MKTNKKKRICSIFMLLCLLFLSVAGSLQTIYAKKSSQPAGYTAFGDSIAAGYSLDGYAPDQTNAPAGSYQSLTAAFLKTQSHNYAVTGNTSDDCISLLHSGKADKDLADADIITLSIGSNDLLLPFIQIVMDYFTSGVQTQDPAVTDPAAADPAVIDPAIIEEQIKNGFSIPPSAIAKLPEYLQKCEGLLNQLSDHATLHAQAAAFADKFAAILSILHEKAPEAEIYVTNIYNPFAFIPKIGELADLYIQEINQAFSANAPDYTLIDVYTPFHSQQLTNVQIDLTGNKIRLDPHPSPEGHAVISNLITNALKKAHAPKAAAIRALSSTSKKKLTVNIKLPANADGCRIFYASSKNGNYQALGKTTANTFQTNVKKLKKGNTYYIRVQSYQTIHGVTYYGSDSSAKKIKIR